ncbi:hypothetical protein XENOCAPTIV_020508 [Xenoophorus captivus]|uniref:Immunoglobulin V-set domain-containing protein n=1 Tax=Xenoophorus captivus TaxID=1517983 RepID=A0ABV0RRN3_9TELE
MAYIFLYRDQHVYSDFQDLAFKDRVDLLDKEMKEGEVSMLLKNATTADTGMYECRVVQAVTIRQKRAVMTFEPNMIIKLRVVEERIGNKLDHRTFPPHHTEGNLRGSKMHLLRIRVKSFPHKIKKEHFSVFWAHFRHLTNTALLLLLGSSPQHTPVVASLTLNVVLSCSVM